VRVVVDDAEPHALVVHPRGDVIVGARRLEQTGWMVVQEHLAAPREARQGEHAADVAARDHPRRLHDPLVVQRADEAHLGPPASRTAARIAADAADARREVDGAWALAGHP